MKKILVVVLILFAAVLVLGLGFTIRHSYNNEIEHLHTTTCRINTCVPKKYECCSVRNLCDTCYNIFVNYSLYMINNTQITTTNHKFGSNNLCDQTSLTCYYDDRDTATSLTIFELHPYRTIGIFIVLFVTFTVSLIIGVIATCRSEDPEFDNPCDSNPCDSNPCDSNPCDSNPHDSNPCNSNKADLYILNPDP